MNLVACSVRGGSSGVSLEEAESSSSVAVKHVVSVPRAFIMSLKVGPDSSSDERRSGGGWALFLISLSVLFLGRFHECFQFGSHCKLENSPTESKHLQGVTQLATNN